LPIATAHSFSAMRGTIGVTCPPPPRDLDGGSERLRSVGRLWDRRGVTYSGEQLRILVERCEQFRGSEAPEGYPNSLALCIVDSVQSTGVKYPSVVNVVNRYRTYRTGQGGRASTDSASDLLATFAELGGHEAWAQRIGNGNRTSTHATAPLKSFAIEEAAKAMVGNGVESAQDLREAAEAPGRISDIADAWRGVKAQSSGVTWHYVQMLAGIQGIKPDRMIARFVAKALGLPVNKIASSFSVEILTQVAKELGMTATELDHAIWNYQRGKPIRPATPRGRCSAATLKDVRDAAPRRRFRGPPGNRGFYWNQAAGASIALSSGAQARAAKYVCIAGPVSIRTRIIRMYPRIHSFASTNDSPLYGFRSPGSVTEPEYSANIYSARLLTRRSCRHARPERRTHADADSPTAPLTGTSSASRSRCALGTRPGRPAPRSRPTRGTRRTYSPRAGIPSGCRGATGPSRA
jgi:hypothetical protein